MQPLPGNLSDLSTNTQSRKVRLRQLAQQLAAMEAAAARHAPIPVIRLEAGTRIPRTLPSDALVIRLGRTEPTFTPEIDEENAGQPS